jgi:hypothetical protein
MAAGPVNNHKVVFFIAEIPNKTVTSCNAFDTLTSIASAALCE